MTRPLVVILLAVLAAGAAHAVELSYAVEDQKPLVYRVSVRGTVDVEGFGAGMYTEGRGEIAITPTGVLEDGGTTLDLVLNRGYVSAGGTYIPSVVTRDVFRITRDARGIVTAVEGDGVREVQKDALMLGISAALLPPLPEGAVEPGDTWSAECTQVSLDGENAAVTGECTLQEVRDDEGLKVAVVVSKITAPARYAYTDLMTGTFEVEVTSEINVDSRVPHKITTKIVGTIESVPTAFEPMKVTFNPLTIELELQPPAEE